MNLLAPKYRVIAPDLPGFGFTEVPAERNYEYTFVNLGRPSLRLSTLSSSPSSLCTFSTSTCYPASMILSLCGADAVWPLSSGAPTGFYLALARPDAITAIISQNGNAYKEGLGGGWAPIQKYWASGSEEDRDAIRGVLTLDFIKSSYTSGVPASSNYTFDPLGWTLDAALVARPGNAEIQLNLFYDYRHNVEAYPRFQQFLREKQLPVLAVWGKNDMFFNPEGAEAYKRDVPDARVVLLDAGHFPLETHVVEIAKEVEAFLG